MIGACGLRAEGSGFGGVKASNFARFASEGFVRCQPSSKVPNMLQYPVPDLRYEVSVFKHRTPHTLSTGPFASCTGLRVPTPHCMKDQSQEVM